MILRKNDLAARRGLSPEQNGCLGPPAGRESVLTPKYAAAVVRSDGTTFYSDIGEMFIAADILTWRPNHASST